MRPRLIVLAIVLCALQLWWVALVVNGLSPDVSSSEEITFVLQANTVGRGHTPVFFHSTPNKYVDEDRWLQPIGVYAIALVQKTGPHLHPGQRAAALAVAINALLVFFIAHSIARTTSAAAAAALSLIFTPGHVTVILRGADSIYPATLVLLWLLGLLRFLRRDSQAALIGAACALGLAIYSHPSGPLTAVFLWILTLAVTWRRNRIRLFNATLIFAAAWIPAAVWFSLHPDSYADTFGRWLILKAHIANPLDAVRAFVNTNTLGNRASLYWEFWNPAWLFMAGSPAPPLHLATAPLILAALVRARRIPREAVTVIFAATLIVPLAGATFGRPWSLDDAAAVLPLIAIISGLGFDQIVALVTRREPLEDDEGPAPVEGWNSGDIAPRS